MNKSIKMILVVSLALSSSDVLAECIGYSGPGGACYTGLGGGLYTGPGGAYTGPGGAYSGDPCNSGPGASSYDQWNRPSPHCE